MQTGKKGLNDVFIFNVISLFAVILGYGNIMNNSENSFLLDFAILFLLISLVSWFMQISEKKKGTKLNLNIFSTDAFLE